MLSQEGSWGEGQASKPTLPGKLGADLADPPLAFGQRLRAGVNGIVAQHEIVRMRHRRAQHELGVRFGHELDGGLAWREDRQLAPSDPVRRSDNAVADGNPEHLVPGWRCVTPALADGEAAEPGDLILALRAGERAEARA